uniref:Uncharacterized protein MANES_16G068600 n=1 Tax=Rhizophora mucronata TaxID=61149 RepID=A0A2P2MIH7_RHIMU
MVALYQAQTPLLAEVPLIELEAVPLPLVITGMDCQMERLPHYRTILVTDLKSHEQMSLMPCLLEVLIMAQRIKAINRKAFLIKESGLQLRRVPQTFLEVLSRTWRCCLVMQIC